MTQVIFREKCASSHWLPEPGSENRPARTDRSTPKLGARRCTQTDQCFSGGNKTGRVPNQGSTARAMASQDPEIARDRSHVASEVIPVLLQAYRLLRQDLLMVDDGNQEDNAHV